MEPKTVEELKQLPQFQEFLGFLNEEVDKLNRLDDIPAEGATFEGIALMVVGRKEAIKTLNQILYPFITPQTPIAKPSNKEFEM